MGQETFFRKNKKKITVIIAIAIFSVGIFLRSYHFHDWLDFGSDQVNDANVVGKVIDHNAPWPLLGSKMSHSGNVESIHKKQFYLGPMFYYFEIVSAKIFGNYPDKLAYPDWLFDILALPLFFLFFKRLFNANISLALAGLWAVSFFAFSFSHSAWNPNPIPFFVLLFLLSLLEFLARREKTDWRWAVFLGLALGVGVQLHAILLALFSLVTLIVFLYLLKKDWRVWKKWGVVFLIALILNAPQIVSELRTNFANSRIFFSSLQESAGTGNSSLAGNIPLDISCHAQANAYILTSLGEDKCNVSFTDPGQWKKTSPGAWADFLFGVLLSIFGYGILIRNFRREKEEKRKYFLGLVLLYVVCFFLIFLPIAGIQIQYRYFLPTVFVPFLFLGSIFDYFARKNFRKFMPLLVLIFSLVVAANYLSLQAAARELLSHTRNGKDHLVLGETEIIVNYIIARTPDSQREAYLVTSRRTANFIKPLTFIAQKNQFEILGADGMDQIPPGKAAFYLQSSDAGEDKVGGKFVTSKNFGQVTLYQLKN